MTAADRLAALDSLPAADLVAQTAQCLTALVDAMNAETTLLRAGRYREAAPHAADKTRRAQDYASLSRAVQRQLPRLKVEAPALVHQLRAGHESFATQLAENLRVIATARTVTETLLGDVATALGRTTRTRTYGAAGTVVAGGPSARGVSINRAL
jgi:hypothetical protein